MIQGSFRLPYGHLEISDNHFDIDAHPVFQGRYKSIIQNFELNSLSQDEIAIITDGFYSKKYSFDEVDRLKLWVCGLFVEPLRLNLLDCNARTKLSSDPASLSRHSYLQKTFMDEITKRLSLLSTLASLCPDQLIPSLIEICPRYLTCSTVNSWLMKHAHIATWEKGEAGEDSKAVMVKFQRSLVKDKRMIERLPSENFQLAMDYEILARNLSLLKDLHINENRTPKRIEEFCLKNNIPHEYASIIHSSEQGSKDLALDIFVKSKGLTSERAFRDVLTKGNYLIKKHGALSFIPEMMFFFSLDFEPHDLHDPKLWRVFESSVSIP